MVSHRLRRGGGRVVNKRVMETNETPEANIRVRKLTQLEAWRLMGFADEDFYKAQAAMN